MDLEFDTVTAEPRCVRIRVRVRVNVRVCVKG